MTTMIERRLRGAQQTDTQNERQADTRTAAEIIGCSAVVVMR